MDRQESPAVSRAAEGFTHPELLVVLVLIGVIVAVLFPVFQKRDYTPIGHVDDASGKPIPNAVLRFRDATGRLAASITADGDGEFRSQALPKLSHDTIDGYGLSRHVYNTGLTEKFYFTPLGTHIATFSDTYGRPISGLNVSFHPDQNTWWSYFQSGASDPLNDKLNQTSDKSGMAQVTDIPTGTRFTFDCDVHYAVAHIQTIADGNLIRYTVTVTPAAIIKGRLVSASGKPLGGCLAFASKDPNVKSQNRKYAPWVTDPTGHFHIIGLPPGTYYVSANQVSHNVIMDTPAAPMQRVVIGSGQTINVNLRATGAAQAP